MTDNQCRVSMSHPSSVRVQLISHKVRSLVRCAPFVATPRSTAIFPNFLEERGNILAHCVDVLRESYQLNAWPESEKVPLWVRRRCAILFHDFINLLLLHGGTLFRGHGCHHDITLTLRVNKKEKKFPGVGDDLNAFLSKDQRNGGRRGYLWYPI